MNHNHNGSELVLFFSLLLLAVLLLLLLLLLLLQLLYPCAIVKSMFIHVHVCQQTFFAMIIPILSGFLLFLVG